MSNVVKMENTKTVEEWRTYISEPWQKAVESIVETGRRLIETKKKVGHGEWTKIFEGNKPFSIHTADRLMAIAKHSILANLAHALSLPPYWFTLYQLSTIPAPALLKLIQDGKVHPELKRSEAEALAKEINGQAEKIETLRQIIIGNCHSAISMAPCDCGQLENEVTPEVITHVQNVIDTWIRVKDYLNSLGVKE